MTENSSHSHAHAPAPARARHGFIDLSVLLAFTGLVLWVLVF